MSKPVHAYTTKLTEEIARTRQNVRGRNGLADQAHLAAARIEEIVGGDRPTRQEHVAICRGLPRMKFYLPILEKWIAEPEPVAPPPSEPSKAKQTQAPEAPTTRPAPLMLTPRTFGEALRAAREGERLSCEEIGELLGVSPAAVRAWEDGTNNPVVSNYVALLETLPRLAADDVPRPEVRDIPKPQGRTTEPAGDPEPEPPPTIARRSPSPLITFGITLGRALHALTGKGTKAVVVALLRDGEAAGLTVSEIAGAIDGAEA